MLVDDLSFKWGKVRTRFASVGVIKKWDKIYTRRGKIVDIGMLVYCISLLAMWGWFANGHVKLFQLCFIVLVEEFGL